MEQTVWIEWAKSSLYAVIQNICSKRFILDLFKLHSPVIEPHKQLFDFCVFNHFCSGKCASFIRYQPLNNSDMSLIV